MALHAAWLGWKQHPQEQGTLGESTASRLGFVFWHVLPMSVAPRLTSAAERAGRSVMGKSVSISTPWA